jgi:hypothetical protein
VLRLAASHKIGWFEILLVAERTLKQGIVITAGLSGLYILSFEVWTTFAHAVHSYTSGFYVIRALHGYSSRNMTHTVLPKAEGLAIEHNSPAEHRRPQTKVFNKTNLHLKDWQSSTVSHLNQGWLSQELGPAWDKVYIPRVEAHSATKSWDDQIHANDLESPW